MLRPFDTGTRALILGAQSFGLEVVKDAGQLAPLRGHKIEIDGRPLFLNEGHQGKAWPTQTISGTHLPFFLHDRRGYFWAGTSAAGLIRTRGEGSRTTPELASSLIEFLFEDREGDIWVGANNGLYCFRYAKVFLAHDA